MGEFRVTRLNCPIATTQDMPPKNKKNSRSPASSSSNSNPPIAASPHISWPSLSLPPPPIRTAQLSLVPLLQNQIYVIPNFFPVSLCNTYIRFLSTLPLVTTPSRPKKGDAVRVNDRFQIEDASFAKDLWERTGLAELVHGAQGPQGENGYQETGVQAREQIAKDEVVQWGGEVVGLNPNIRIYKYGKGQYFDKHYDDSNVLQFSVTPDTSSTVVRSARCHTTYTLLLYLTAPPEVTGGETVFYNELPKQSGKKGIGGTEVIKVGLEKGVALLHKHGKDCLLHEGAMVTAGEKWVLRTDLVVRG